MSDVEFGFGFDCIKYRHILMKGNSNIFEWNYLGGVIDIEKHRLGGPTLLEMMVKYLKIAIKYFLITFVLGKIEYIAIGLLIYILIFKIIIPFYEKDIYAPFHGLWCKIYDFALPTISINLSQYWSVLPDWSSPYIQPFHKMMKDLKANPTCPCASPPPPGGCDALATFDHVKHGSCISRFGRSASGIYSDSDCKGLYATDFTLYGENDDGTSTGELCGDFMSCRNAPVHYLIGESILSDFTPMVGFKGINYGSAPFKYLTCCDFNQDTCNQSDINAAINATNYANKFPQGFDSTTYKKNKGKGLDISVRDPWNFLSELDGTSKDPEPFKSLTNYSITSSDFVNSHPYDSSEGGTHNCKPSRYEEFFTFYGWTYADLITGIRMVIWGIIVFLLFTQIHDVIRRIYNGFQIQANFPAQKQSNAETRPKTHMNNTIEGLDESILKDDSNFIKEMIKICDPGAVTEGIINLESLNTVRGGEFHNYYKFLKCIDQPLKNAHIHSKGSLKSIDDLSHLLSNKASNVINKITGPRPGPGPGPVPGPGPTSVIQDISSGLDDKQTIIFGFIMVISFIVLGIISLKKLLKKKKNEKEKVEITNWPI